MVTHILPEVFIYLERSQRPEELHLVTGGNTAWEQVNDLGLTVAALGIHDDEISGAGVGSFALTDCASKVTGDVAGTGTATFPSLEVGAYVVREIDAPSRIVEHAAPFIVTVPTPAIGAQAGQWLYDVHVFPKNQELLTPGKVISGQGADSAVLGDDITYEITQTIPGVGDDGYTSFRIVDRLDPKLDYVPGTVTVFVNGTAVSGEDLDDVIVTWETAPTRALEVALVGGLLADLEADHTVTVTFTARANAPGAIDNEPVTFLNDWDVIGTPVQTRWGAVDLAKVNASVPVQGSDPFPGLVGAEFELWMGPSDVPGCAAENATGNARVPGTVVSGANGVLGMRSGSDVVPLTALWVGDDSVGGTHDYTERCYYLVETKAPAGFVLPAAPNNRTEFIVHAGETAHPEATRAIENAQQQVPEIPLTGAAGQVIILVAGASLIAVALSLVLVKRRKTVGE